MKHEFFEEVALPKTTKQMSGRRAYDKAAVRLAKAIWLAIARKNAPKVPFQGALRLHLVLTWPQAKKARQKAQSVKPMASKPDVDNICKLILDAMTKARWWKDDSYICDLRVAKFTGPIIGVSCRLATWEEDL